MERSHSRVFQATCQNLFKVRLNVPFTIFFERDSSALQARDNVHFYFYRWGIVKIPWLRSGSLLGSRDLHM